MKTLLLLFVSAVAWGQTIESRAVMLKGTSLPGTCAIGERFFKTDATAGENLYLATNDSPCTWTQVVGSGGGSGASAVTDLTDCKVTTASATATMAACNFSYLGSDGRWTVAAMSSATWVISGGTDTGTARFEIDPNGGSPIWRCLYDGSMTATNYTPTNCTETSGSVFSVGAYPVATVAVSSGAWSTVTNFRALPQVANYTVDGNYLLKSGNALSFNPAASFPWTGPHSSESTYNYCAPSGASGTTYACTISPAITALATGVHYFFKADVAVTGAATINFNGLGAKTIKKYTGTGGADLAADDIRAGAIVHVVYDGTNMQLQTGLGNAGGGGTPGGSTTQIQYNNAGAFGGEAGLTWDATNKAVTITRSNTSGIGGRLYAVNSSTGNINTGSRVEACQENSLTDCATLLRGNYNLAGEGYGGTTQLRSQFGSSSYQLIGRRGDTSPVHIGGDDGAGLGWFSVLGTGVTRFANVATAGIGLAPIMGVLSLTAQTGDVAATNLLASSHTAGTYRVCGVAAITTPGTGSFAAWTLSWRSPASGTDLNHDLIWSQETATFTVTPGVTAAEEFSANCKTIRSTGASAIVVNPGTTDATYNLYFTAERTQ